MDFQMKKSRLMYVYVQYAYIEMRNPSGCNRNKVKVAQKRDPQMS